MITSFICRHQPWLAPTSIQEESGCVIGKHYPEPMIDLARAGERNAKAMIEIRQLVTKEGENTPLPEHCRPSNDEEICKFFWINQESSLSQRTAKVN